MFIGYSPMFYIQECKIQNLAREYCKIFAAETRVIENFGPSLEWVHFIFSWKSYNNFVYLSIQQGPLSISYTLTIFVKQGDSSLFDVPTSERCTIRHSGDRSHRSVSEILWPGLYWQNRHEDWLWGGAEVLYPAALDLSVDQWKSAVHSTWRYGHTWSQSNI